MSGPAGHGSRKISLFPVAQLCLAAGWDKTVKNNFIFDSPSSYSGPEENSTKIA
jgi:hypothetical protein